MSFIVTTYNVLANRYIRPEYYPHTPSNVLDPPSRRARLVAYIEQLHSDIFCLQEMEPEVFTALRDRLARQGYWGELVMKGEGKPDGCALFFNRQRFELSRSFRLDYLATAIDEPLTGHIAQIVMLQEGTRGLAVANTHLKWDAQERHGLRQIQQLMENLAGCTAAHQGTIICGDFNVTPQAKVVRLLREAGYEYTHTAWPGVCTCNAHQRAKMVDYLFHNAALAAQALPVVAVANHTPLPGGDQPSDHVPVAARFSWRV